jgi:nucleolar GTP-binding protein
MKKAEEADDDDEDYEDVEDEMEVDNSVKQKRKQPTRRMLERDLEMELGDDYVLDLCKKYDLPDEEKYDTIPEFWEGHNIADYIDPDIFKVCKK